MNRIPKDLSYDIETHIGKSDVEIECKIRFPNMDRDMFHLLIKKLTKSFSHSKRWKRIDSHTIDFYRKEKRFTKIGPEYYNTTKSAPSLLRVIDYDNYDLKFTVSKEKMSKTKEPKTYDFMRVKDRISFVKGNISIDLTTVIHEDKQDEEVPPNYEVEVEVIDSSKFNSSVFYETIFIVVNMLIEPDKVLIPFFNRALTLERGRKIEKNTLDRNLVSRPRDLKIEDITNDGLLQSYAISVKIDGEPKFMVFHPSLGIWFIQFSRDTDKMFEQISEICPEEYKNSIFVGEVIDNKYFPFDCPFFGGRKIGNQNFLQRRKYIDHIIGKRIGCYNILDLKIFTYHLNPNDFHKTVGEAFLEDPGVPTDGLIFNPIYSDYVAEGQNKSKKERVLSKYSDVCKYKLPENRTIDFEVLDGMLHSAGNILFSGSEKYPFCANNYSLEIPSSDQMMDSVENSSSEPMMDSVENSSYEPMTSSQLEGKIVEFKPYIENGNVVYRPIRIRNDKDFPNSIDVAIENWETQFNPITPDVLLGKDIRLLEIYLENIITRLINERTTEEDYVINISDTNLISRNPMKTLNIDIPRISDIGDAIPNIRNKKLKEFIPLHPQNNLIINYYLETLDEIDILKDIIRIYKTERNGSGKLLINVLYRENRDERILDSLISILSVDIKILEQGRGSGKETNAPIMNEDLIARAREYVYFVGMLHDTKEFITDCRLEVDVNKRYNIDKGYVAYGDDKIEDMKMIDQDIVRIATIDNGNSLIHSLLKLLNYDYRNGGVIKRLDMAKQAPSDLSIEELAKKLKHNIYVYSTDPMSPETIDVRKIKNDDVKKFVMLFKNTDGSYEPLARLNDLNELDLVFM